MTDFEERRRFARVRVQHHRVSVVTRARVRVLDISLGGALMASDTATPITRARLTMPLPGGRFTAQTEVRHQYISDGGSVQFGAVFVEMSHESRRSLEQFLAKTGR